MRSTIWQTKARDRTFSLGKEERSVFRWHHHEYCEIFIPMEGRGKTIVGDYAGQVIPGQVYLVGPLVPHTFYTADQVGKPQKGLTFCVSEVSIDKICKSLPELAGLSDLQNRAKRGLLFGDKTAFRVLEILDGSPRVPKGLNLAIMILRILDVLARAGDSRPLVSSYYEAKINDREYSTINAIADYLHRRHTSVVRLADVAEHVHISQPTLCRLAKRAFGKTIVEYINELRIGHACHLLTETDLPITTIAMRSGYNTLSNFNRMFIRLRQMTPHVFRRVNLGSDK